MNILFENGFFSLITEKEKVFISVKRMNVDMALMHACLKHFPQIKINTFANLQVALKEGIIDFTEVGVLKPLVEVEIASDDMLAYVKLNISQEQYEKDYVTIKALVENAIVQNGVTSGYIQDAIQPETPVSKKICVARGIEPITGADAKIIHYQLAERVPRLADNGNADFYELNLINNVHAGDWLGEKIHATKGIPGITVKGNTVEARPGLDAKLNYDSKTVDAIKMESKTVLRAKMNGAVAVNNRKIGIEKHLYLSGNVDFETGNIRFDGNVTVSGTVADKFVLEATGDIVINSPDGIGAAERIESTNGSIFITGGINGKNIAKVIAAENVYVKYVNEGYIEAQNEVHVAKYIFDSYIKANKVMLDPKLGRIVGGQVIAKHKIVSGSLGNMQERQTKVHVEGFERTAILCQLEALNSKRSEIEISAKNMRHKLELLEKNREKLDDRATNTLDALLHNYHAMLEEIEYIIKCEQQLEDMLKTRGDGEIKLYQNVYPKTTMEIKRLQKQIMETMKCSFYVKDNKLHITD